MKPPDVIVIENIKNDDKVKNFIDLMNWAFAHKDIYLYNRALENMLKLLYK